MTELITEPHEKIEANEQTEVLRDTAELHRRIANLPVRTGRWTPEGHAPIDQRGHRYLETSLEIGVPSRMSGLKGTDADDYILRQLRANNTDTDQAVNEHIMVLKERAEERFENNMWWHVYYDHELYRHNPIEDDTLADQVVFSDGGEQIKLHNYTEPLMPEAIDAIREVIEEYAQLTNSKIFEVTQAIVIHDAFAEQYFKVEDANREPSGRSYSQKGMIEVNGDIIHKLHDALRARQLTDDDRNAEELVARYTKRLKVIIAHELAHQIDADMSRGNHTSFTRYFDYEENSDPEDHRLVVTPKQDAFKRWDNQEPLFCAEVADTSVPTYDYGHSNAAEDFATASELLILAPRNLDPLRREALLQLISDEYGRADVPLDRAGTIAQYVPQEQTKRPGIDDLRLPSYILLHAQLLQDTRMD